MSVSAPGVGRPEPDDEPLVERVGASLLAFLGVARNDVVAVVGAGGKSTLLRCLALEARGVGWRVLLTSTTHRGPGVEAESVLFDEDGDTERRLAGAVAETRLALVMHRPLRDDKWEGLESRRIAELRPLVDLVLVEADGARRRLFKAPAPHEPVIPPFATHVIVVAALRIVGRELREDLVHRVEVVGRLSGLPYGGTVDDDTFCQVLTHPHSYPGRCPSSAQRILFLNTAGAPRGLELARRLVGRLLEAHDLVVAGPACLGDFRLWTRSHLLPSRG